MKKFIFAAVLPVLHIFGVIDASAAIPYFPLMKNQRGTRPFFCAGWSFCAGGWNCLNAIWKRQILRS